MDWLSLLRALHVLSVVHWIGGVSFVTLSALPAIRSLADPDRRMSLFEAVEGRFAAQARISVTLAGLTGLLMTQDLAAWDRFLDLSYWWMHLMLAVWLAFTLVLFVAEPLFLHDWFHRAAIRDSEATFRLVQRFHYVLLVLSSAAICGAVLGAHGALY